MTGLMWCSSAWLRVSSGSGVMREFVALTCFCSVGWSRAYDVYGSHTHGITTSRLILSGDSETDYMAGVVSRKSRGVEQDQSSEILVNASERMVLVPV
nr:hypothetical protein Iba_chr03bCG0680 [Ipomoea batatas]